MGVVSAIALCFGAVSQCVIQAGAVVVGGVLMILSMLMPTLGGAEGLGEMLGGLGGGGGLGGMLGGGGLS
jgi:hypothetical protein